jgi:hypothetical protein
MTAPRTSTEPRVSTSPPGLRRALGAVGLLGCGGATAAFLLAGPGSAAGVAAGGCLGLANLWAFGRLGSGLLSAVNAKPLWIALALAKLVLLFGTVFSLLSLGIVGPLELALGYLAMPAGITLSYVVFPDTGLDRKSESA